MDQKGLKIARHETDHAVMAMLCRRVVQKISLKELRLPNGTENLDAYISLEAESVGEKLTARKAFETTVIALGG